MSGYVDEWTYNIMFMIASIITLYNLIISAIYCLEAPIVDVVLIVNLIGNIIFLFILCTVYCKTIIETGHPRDWQEFSSVVRFQEPGQATDSDNIQV